MRSFIALLRNDLPDNLLQFVDVTPNTSRTRAGGAAGNTGYLSFNPQNELPVSAGAGPFTAAADVKGLTAYLVGNVEDVLGGNITLQIGDATTVATNLLARVGAGLAVTLADINTLIVAVVGAGSDLDGAGAGSSSTGSVDDIMAILGGACYRIDAGTVIAGIGGAWPGVAAGDFVAATDDDYRDIRSFAMSGSLNLSALSGQLSKLQDATYQWLNPAMTYGATGTALFTDGAHIPATGIGRAVTVYDETGALL